MNIGLRDHPGQPGGNDHREILGLMAEDLLLLAALHDREVSAPLLGELRRGPLAERLFLGPGDAAGESAFAVFDAALASDECDGTSQHMDELAADFAAIYLNNSYSLSPLESTWVDPEGLIMQEAMFEIRRWYHHYGVAAGDWRKRPDDHLVHQLEFIAHLLTHPVEHAPKDAAAFIDHHILRWIEPFSMRVAQRCEKQFYAGLALVTAAVLHRLRDVLVDVADMPLIELEPIEEEKRRRREEAQKQASERYLPGAAPSW
ncbi:MAG TPA: molecular chaperone TorD family protein [Beijerinckiaceae bacterium]|nr:molecular chaperone TorD family protein [Beijerinckiaceae bacterium]